MSTPAARLLLLLVLALPCSVEAATFTVDTTVDDPALTACDADAPNDCSLRGAILTANGRPLPETSTIDVPAGTYVLSQSSSCTYQRYGSPTFFTSSQVPLCVAKNVALQGVAAAATIIDGNQAQRVFFISANATAQLSNITIAHGRSDRSFGLNPNGGGIVNEGTLTLTDSVVRDNSLDPAAGATGGGGIFNTGVLALQRSAVSDNLSPSNDLGGGILNYSQAVLTVSDSAISDNVIGGIGGGICNVGGVVTITNSTISGNTANGSGGGGITSFGGNFIGTLTVVNSTISNNTSDSTGGGINVGSLTETHLNNVTITANACVRPVNQGGCTGGGVGGPGISVQNTLIAGNDSTNGAAAHDCSGSLVSRGYNLIEITNGCVITGDTTGNIIGVDAKLGVLADNGGFTQTHGLGEGSPAIDAGSPAAPGSGGAACAASDQRGLLRPLGARCDIGAFERSIALSLSKVLPNVGSNDGSVMALLTGGGFAPAATNARLRRAGHADIVGTPVATEQGGAVLTTSFDLTGAEVGTWDVVVTNPDLTSVTLAGEFTVETPRAADLFAIVVARSSARPGLPARFAVLYGNRGNADALGVPLTLGLPASSARRFAFEVAAPPAQPGQAFDYYDGVPSVVAAAVASDDVDIPLLIPIVPAGYTGVLAFTLTPPVGSGGSELAISAILGTPWFANKTVRTDVVAEAAVRARQFAADGLGITAGPELDPALIAYETAALELAVAAARDDLVHNVGQVRRVYSLAYFAIDLAGQVAALATASTTPAPRIRLAALPRWLASSFDFVASPVEAQTVCPPCLCGAVLQPGCLSCKDSECIKPIDPDKPPKNPSSGLTPAACNDIPKHIVSADGKTCKPTGGQNCPKGIGSPFGTDPFCRFYPIKDSHDPNDKAGSGGSGPERFVRPGTPLPYMIAFENLPAATAAAQTVVVTDQLDTAELDLESFALGPILVGDIGITPPPGLTSFTGGADLRPAHNVILKVEAGLDKATGLVTWSFTSLDPATLETLTDPDEGFLPPNTDPPAGDGQVHFTILPKAGLASGTEIRNQAHVVFDTNAPIDTPEWLNTIDASAPTSQVDSVDPADCSATDLTVHWSGTDTGSGIGSYSVFVATDGGPFLPLVSDTAATSAPFMGQAGKSYGFYSVARDHAGNLETPPVAPDVVRPVGGCASNDLAVTKISAPKTVTLNAKNPSRLVRVSVQIQNRSAHAEVVPDAAVLANLVHLEVETLASGCPAPVAVLHAGKPQKALPVTVKAKKKLAVVFDVTIGCANDPLKSSAKSPGHEDYSLRATVHHSALGSGDPHLADDVCPREVAPPGVVDAFPNGKLLDKGCGAKKADKTFGAPIQVDVIVKP